MINIKVNIDINENILKEIEITGHSHFAEKGKDIVCSAVSSLIYATLLTLKQMPIINIDFIDNDDQMKIIILDIKNEVKGEIRGISLSLINGLLLIKENYQNNIEILINENTYFN